MKQLVESAELKEAAEILKVLAEMDVGIEADLGPGVDRCGLCGKIKDGFIREDPGEVSIEAGFVDVSTETHNPGCLHIRTRRLLGLPVPYELRDENYLPRRLFVRRILPGD